MRGFGACIAFYAFTFAVAADPVRWKADFTNNDVWLKPRRYSGSTVFTIKPDSLSIKGTATNKADTAWQMETKMLPVRQSGKYVLVFKFLSHGVMQDHVGSSSDWDSVGTDPSKFVNKSIF